MSRKEQPRSNPRAIKSSTGAIRSNWEQPRDYGWYYWLLLAAGCYCEGFMVAPGRCQLLLAGAVGCCSLVLAVGGCFWLLVVVSGCY